MRRMLAITGTLVSFLLLIPCSGLSAASSFAAPPFQVVWQRGEAAFPNFWGPLSLAKDGQQEPYKEAPGGQRLVQYFDKARMELTNPAMPTVVTNGLLTVELKTGKVQLGDNTFEQRSPARINIAGDPGSDSLTYADLAQLPERDAERPLPDLQPPRAFINGQIMTTPQPPYPRPSRPDRASCMAPMCRTRESGMGSMFSSPSMTSSISSRRDKRRLATRFRRRLWRP